MIIDKLENFGHYVAMNPLFEEVWNFLKTTDLKECEIGKQSLHGDDLLMNVTMAQPKTQAEARLETHVKYIDIQIPLSGTERMGYTPTADLKESIYDEAKDISFYEGPADNYLEVKPGMFVVFFPEDGHAPAITPAALKKVIFKVKA
jgi:YhcH/YjgK/YiaL family protein